MSPITLAIEVVLAVMLAACLYYFWRLDRRLAALRNGQDGVLAAAAELAQATAQAEQAVRALRAASQDAGRDLQARIDTATSRRVLMMHVRPPIGWASVRGACARGLTQRPRVAASDGQARPEVFRFGAAFAGGDGHCRRRARAEGRGDGAGRCRNRDDGADGGRHA